MLFVWMITLLVSCSHCQSTTVVRNGATADGRQRYLCRDCGRRSTADPRPNGYTEEQRELILRAYQERSSLRGLTRTFGVSRNTVTSWLKKSRGAPALEQHGITPEARYHPGVGVGRAVVVCTLESGTGLGLGGFGPQHAPDRRLLPGRSQRGELPLLVGTSARALARRHLLHRFLESVSGRRSGGAACGRQRKGRDGPCRTIQ